MVTAEITNCILWVNSVFFLSNNFWADFLKKKWDFVAFFFKIINFLGPTCWNTIDYYRFRHVKNSKLERMKNIYLFTFLFIKFFSDNEFKKNAFQDFSFYLFFFFLERGPYFMAQAGFPTLRSFCHSLWNSWDYTHWKTSVMLLMCPEFTD